ncbi:MAG TPA: glycosyltransferase family 2 protein [Candidatus Binataceae bacterium]|nr:glycosyltransferase family 2 protein [Candidatus Binataceae bacterium]
MAPMRDESANVDEFFSRMVPVLEGLGMAYEIICINDGSNDDTLEKLLAIRNKNPAVKVVSLSRNFGKDVALSAGLDYSSGAAVIPIDCDLQDPPELIVPMVAKWREGYDVVFATRRSRMGESWVKRTTASLFYRFMERMTDVPIPRDTGDFRLLDRRVVEVLVRLPERSRFMKGLFAWVGFKQTSVFYERDQRHAGLTKWSYWNLWNFAIDGITSFSSLPLKLGSYLGLIISAGAFLYALFIAILKIGKGIDLPGYPSLLVVVLFLGGVQLITLGVIGEYLGRVYNEVKGRPLYLVKDLYGFDENSK